MDLECINLSDLSDAQIASRMRNCNYEKFKTLVRMHLSFELDLNTDEFDLPCHEIVYEDKGKLKKWNRVSKKHKQNSTTTTALGCAAAVKGGSSGNSNSASNSPTDGLQQQIDAGFLMHLDELKAFLLMDKNVTQEGIFRKTGSVSRQNELRLQIQSDDSLNLERSGYSVHDCATVFKGYLAELPEPLLTDAHYPAYLEIAPLCIGSALKPPHLVAYAAKPPNPERLKRDHQLLNSVQLLLLLLPEENRHLLQHVIELLHTVAGQHALNKMSPENLATLFSPHLICPRNLPPEALHYVAKKMSGIITYMVIRGGEIFEVPPKLATDIRAYFLERKRKKTMSPEQMLDDSISDISTVNTVYTFVDREKTAAAHNTNTTDTELAQLYAHIQSLPESSKKRRLIKQFNKQNGQGTPLQFVVMNRMKNPEVTRSAKSISDSIKKHIFHKGIMSRTPKRHAVTAAMSSGVETPNSTNTKAPKLRVLFQSPAPATNHPTITVAPPPSTSINAPTNSSYAPLKMHPLQKSISSSSLILNASKQQLHDDLDSVSTSSNDAFSTQSKVEETTKSASAPVSRQVSGELSGFNDAQQHLNSLESNCCSASLKFISDAAKNLIGGNAADKKSVAWMDDPLLQIKEEDNTSPSSEESTAAGSSELKSRYKSEPNLSCIMTGKLHEVAEHTPIFKGSKSLTRKLMKGVSMGNLKFAFTTPETTKRLVRSVSSTLKRRASDEMHGYFPTDAAVASGKSSATTPLLEDLDDETFEDDLENDSGSSGSDVVDNNGDELNQPTRERIDSSSNELPEFSGAVGGAVPGISASYQQLLLQQSGAYRNMNVITSTPSMLLSRRSMSPITKSTQRMPKAMQESIMTPRSRKPVMVLTTTTSSDQNQTICQTDMGSFRAQDERASNASERKQYQNVKDSVTVAGERIAPNDNALTENFKEYLLSRSVLTASPVDSSFSSQPDDFGGGSTTQDVEDLDESQLSPSLLYCLDGNQPDGDDNELQSGKTETPTSSHLTDANQRLNTNPFLMFNNARKRAATNDTSKVFTMLPSGNGSSISSSSNGNNDDNTEATSICAQNDKENCEQVEGYHLLTKKLLITEYPGETSL